MRGRSINAVLKWVVVGVLVTQAFSALAQDRPRIYYSAQAISRLQTLATDSVADAEGVVPKQAIAAILARADQFIAKPYSFTLDSFSYTFSATPPEPHTPATFPYWSPMFQERADAISTRLQTLTFAWLATDDTKYYDAALQMATMLSAWPTWTDPQVKCLDPACLDTAHATMAVAFFYDQAFSKLSSTEKSSMKNALVKNGAEILSVAIDKRKTLTPFNGDAILISGLGLAGLALLGDDSRAQAWITQAEQQTKRFLDEQGIDGGCLEGVFYGFYAYTYLVRWIAALHQHNTTPLLTHPALRHLSDYAVAMVTPGGKDWANFGDATRNIDFSEPFYFLGSLGDAHARHYLKMTGQLGIWNFMTAAWYAPSVTPKVSPSLEAAAFVTAGHSTMRTDFGSDALFVAMRTGSHTAALGHNHYDQNSIVMTAGSTWLLADYGYVNDATSATIRATTESVGHNTLLIDGAGQTVKSGSNAGRTVRTASVNLLEGYAHDSYPGKGLTEYRRQVLLVKPSYVVVHDRVRASNAHVYQLVFTDWELGTPIANNNSTAEIQTSSRSLWLHSTADYPVNFQVANFAGAETLPKRLVANINDMKAVNGFDAITTLFPLDKNATSSSHFEGAAPKVTTPTENAICLDRLGAFDCLSFSAESGVSFETPHGTFQGKGEIVLAGFYQDHARLFLLNGSSLTVKEGISVTIEGGTATVGLRATAQKIDATLEWQSGSSAKISLNAPDVTTVEINGDVAPFHRSPDGVVIVCSTKAGEHSSCGLPEFNSGSTDEALSDRAMEVDAGLSTDMNGIDTNSVDGGKENVLVGKGCALGNQQGSRDSDALRFVMIALMTMLFFCISRK